MSAPPAIRARGIDKAFGAARAVDSADLVVNPGELVALLGPSGSGKTTLLRIIAGFETPDAGSIEIGGRTVVDGTTWVEPERRHIGMVFQDGALFPHLTVADNVGFGGPRPGRVEECLELVGLAHRSRAFPHELSGGEQQRVALARALAPDPDVVLLDEPFASLDAGLRVALREQVAAILRDAGASALLVTHNQQEALSLADSVVVMRDGHVEQSGSPEDLYDRPATRWIAEFLGDAEIVAGVAADGQIDTELGVFPADRSLRGSVQLVLRPEWVHLGPDCESGSAAGATKATVVDRSFFGHDQLVRVQLDSGLQVRSRLPGAARWHPGDVVAIHVEGPVTVLAS